MVSRENRFVGKTGESIARRFLKAKGYAILNQNYRTPFGEIDIVARHKRTLVFVEVKTRASYSLGPPYLSVTAVKQNHLIKNALFYQKIYGLLGSDWRIDVVSVKLRYDGGPADIEIIENAVENNDGGLI